MWWKLLDRAFIPVCTVGVCFLVLAFDREDAPFRYLGWAGGVVLLLGLSVLLGVVLRQQREIDQLRDRVAKLNGGGEERANHPAVQE